MILWFKGQESPRETHCSWTWFPNQGEHFIYLLESTPWSALYFLLFTALRTLMESRCLCLCTNCFWEVTGLCGRQCVWNRNSSKPVAGQHQSAFYQSFRECWNKYFSSPKSAEQRWGIRYGGHAQKRAVQETDISLWLHRWPEAHARLSANPAKGKCWAQGSGSNILCVIEDDSHASGPVFYPTTESLLLLSTRNLSKPFIPTLP